MNVSLLALDRTSNCAGSHVFLDEPEENERRDHGQRRRGHQTSPIRRVLLQEGLDADWHRHPIFVWQENAGNKMR